MKRLFSGITLFILMGFPGMGNNQHLFDSANKHYSANEFEKAISLYEEILESGLASPEVYFNLGNANYRLNSLSGAILNYERALKLAPGDKDVLFNLKVANAHLKDRIEEIPEVFFIRWFNSLSAVLTSAQWAWLAIAAFILLLTSAGLFVFSKSVSMRKAMFLSAVFSLILTVAFLFLSREQMKVMTDKTSAVIVAPMVVVKSSPDENSADIFILHEGTKVNVREKLGHWLEIRIADGKQGWLPKNALEVI